MGWTLAVVLAALLVGAIFLYNRLIADRNLARQGYADIDVQLKRRADLVPQLVEAVKGYAGYERALLTTVTELRTNALAAQGGAARFALEKQLGERLGQVLLLQENYPQLKADANNAQSRAAILRLGAVYEGILRKQMLRPHDGYERDTAMFSIIESEWPAVKAALEAKLAR